MFGSLTITGSFMAFGKLQGFIPSAPITYKFQNQSNIGLFCRGRAACSSYLVVVPSTGGDPCRGVLPDGPGRAGRRAC